MIDAIIVNYRTYELTIRAAESALRDPLCAKVIIVDGASPDESGAQLAKHFKGNSRVIVSLLTENVGFGRANNHGVSLATSEYVFLLNSDAELCEGGLAILINSFTSGKVGVAVPLIKTAQLVLQDDVHGMFPSLKDVLFQKPAHTIKGEEPDWISGVAMLVKTSVYRELGGFDADFFMYMEDIDFCYRLRAKGYRISVVSEAEVVHLGGGSKQTSQYQKKQYYRSQDLYFKKRGYSFITRFLLSLARLAGTGYWIRPA